MTIPKWPEGNSANRRIDRPQDAKMHRGSADSTASTRLAVAKPLFGGELSGHKPGRQDSETGGALKRAAENERRS